MLINNQDHPWEQATITDAAYDVSANVGLTGESKVFLVPSSVNPN